MSTGSFRFVVLMDRIEDRLKDLITFMNQNSRFDVFGVELEYYEYEDLEILIPNLFGAEVKKTVGSSSAKRKNWDEKSFFADARNRLAPEEVEAIEQLYAWAMKNADELSWGTGARRGSFNPKFKHVSSRSVFRIYSDGTLDLNFTWLDGDYGPREFGETLGRKLRQELDDFDVPEDYLDHHIGLEVETWRPQLVHFIEILDETLDDPATTIRF